MRECHHVVARRPREILSLVSGDEPVSWEQFRRELTSSITPEQAAAVRRLRVDEDETWWGVSERFSEDFGSALYEAELAGNQIVGKYLCEAAARTLGEDPEAAWN